MSNTQAGLATRTILTILASDWLIGDNVMRSLYTVYDFGAYDSSGEMGDPYMQLLALVAPNEASKEFHDSRGGSASSNITYIAKAVSTTNASGSSSDSTVSTADIASTLNKLNAYIPAMLAVMALNALVILVLAAAGIVYMCRRHRRSRSARTRRTPGRATPMPLARASSYMDDSSMPGPGGLGAYQPVSMALTEDTFVPPTPAFSKPGFGDSTIRAGDRPKSVA